MPKSVKIETCKVCGLQAKAYKWWTKSRSGKKYSYIKYVHDNGQVHYVNLKNTPDKENINFREYIELFVKETLNNKNMRFMEFKRAVESKFNIKINNQTFWRAINRMIKFRELQKIEKDGRTYYTKGPGVTYSGLYVIEELYISLNVEERKLAITIKLYNKSSKIQTSFAIMVPEENLVIDNYTFNNSFDLFGKLANYNFKTTYSYADETGLVIDLNKPIKPFERDILHLEFLLKNDQKYRALIIPLDAGNINIFIISKNKGDFSSKKISLDYSKEMKADVTSNDKNTKGEYIYAFFYNTAKANEIITIESS